MQAQQQHAQQTQQQQQQQAAAQQQQAQAQLAVNQAVQQAMQHRQQGGQQSITDLAVNYMSAISAANIAKTSGGGGAAAAVPGQPGNWDPRLSYPMMSQMNTLHAMSSMPNLLSLQQQYAQHPSMAGRSYNLDAANMILGAAGGQHLMSALDARKSRHIKSPAQLKTLKLFFAGNQRPSKDDIRKLVKDTTLPHQEVTRWFRNERHKEKKQQEAKNEALQGHLKNGGQQHHGHPGMPHMHMAHMGGHMGIHQLHKAKRKRPDGTDETDDEEEPLHPGYHGNSPDQRMQAIQTFIHHLSDHAEVDVAEKSLAAKRAELGMEGVPSLPALGGSSSPDSTWQLLQQQFGSFKEGQDAKRRKTAGKDSVNAAAAAAGVSQQIDPGLLHGLSQIFAKHPDYLKEINKNIQPQQQQQQQQQHHQQ